jgi:hypothetical protein
MYRGRIGITGLAADSATVSRSLFGVFLLMAVVLFALVLLGIGART